VRLLLDTHVLLWAAAASQRLSLEVRELLEDGANEVFYSAANLWEIAIKATLGRKDFRVDPALLEAALPAMGLVELPITGAHAIGVARLPRLHRDPFDRLLLSQTLTERLTLLTHDRVLTRYGPHVRLV
jgi:PIN domain nuclease of toxin-antitoxin system